jgi:hypothetical protein
MISNPFHPLHLPIVTPERLFGRDHLVRPIVEMMIGERPSACLGLFGPRRIGKSSIVKCSEAIALQSKGPLTPVVVYEDCAIWQAKTQDQVLERLCGGIHKWTGVASDRIDPTDALQEVLEVASASGVRVTFVFDEVGRAAKNPRLDEGFFSYLRGLTSTADIQFITCSPEPLTDYWTGLPTADSTFFGLFTTEFIGPISHESSVAMRLAPAAISRMLKILRLS